MKEHGKLDEAMEAGITGITAHFANFPTAQRHKGCGLFHLYCKLSPLAPIPRAARLRVVSPLINHNYQYSISEAELELSPSTFHYLCEKVRKGRGLTLTRAVRVSG